MKIYVASSWRNLLQQGVVHTLRAAGHEVYDFKNPAPGNDGFRWTEIDPEWQSWSPERYRECLNHPVAIEGFDRDMNALRWCEVCVLVLPCGRSAHLEAGWAAGAGKPVFVLQVEPAEPELMNRMTAGICTSLVELLEKLEQLAEEAPAPTGTPTPGPWREGKCCGAIVADTGTDDPGTIAYYGGHVIAESVGSRNRPLIIAAPDLYAALSEILECEDHFYSDAKGARLPEMLVPWGGPLGVIFKVARAALAKANGGAA